MIRRLLNFIRRTRFIVVWGAYDLKGRRIGYYSSRKFAVERWEDSPLISIRPLIIRKPDGSYKDIISRGYWD